MAHCNDCNYPKLSNKPCPACGGTVNRQEQMFISGWMTDMHDLGARVDPETGAVRMPDMEAYQSITKR